MTETTDFTFTVDFTFHIDFIFNIEAVKIFCKVIRCWTLHVIKIDFKSYLHCPNKRHTVTLIQQKMSPQEKIHLKAINVQELSLILNDDDDDWYMEKLERV